MTQLQEAPATPLTVWVILTVNERPVPSPRQAHDVLCELFPRMDIIVTADPTLHPGNFHVQFSAKMTATLANDGAVRISASHDLYGWQYRLDMF